jgi:hypothetical protein
MSKFHNKKSFKLCLVEVIVSNYLIYIKNRFTLFVYSIFIEMKKNGMMIVDLVTNILLCDSSSRRSLKLFIYYFTIYKFKVINLLNRFYKKIRKIIDISRPINYKYFD